MNSFYTFTAHRPLFLISAPNFTRGCYRPPDSFQRPQGGFTAHFEKHWSRESSRGH